MKIAICDDEKHYCKQIQECVEIYLDKHHIYGKTEIFMDGNALLERGMLAVSYTHLTLPTNSRV